MSEGIDLTRNAIAFRMEVPTPPTAEESARIQAARAEKARRRAEFTAALTEAGGLVAALAALHTANEHGDCAEESDLYSVQWYTPWPCDTLLLAAEHAGIDVEGL